MSSVTEPATKQSRQGGGVQYVQECLDALSSGASDESHFLRAAADLLHKSPDAGWELLGLVDQYHRRGRISAQTFGALKAHLQGLLVGTGTSDEVSAPVPRMQDEPPLTVALPPQGAAGSSARPRVRSPSAASEMPTSPVAAAASAAPAPGPPLTPAATAYPGLTPAPPLAPAAAARPGLTPAPPLAPAAAGRPGLTPPPPLAPAAAARPAAAPPAAPASAAAAAVGNAAGPRTLSPGDLLRGRYLVQGLLGQGGMGTVYAAIDQFRLDRTHGDQQVALKVLHTEVIQRPRLFAELRREFQHLQSLSHPNIVRVHEFDRDGDLAFFTMEYLSGALLSRVLSAQPSVALQRPYALALIRDVGSAAAHAHARGVVHGDLNPGNIFITDDGEVRVLDFGASHKLHRHPWISEFDDHRPTPVATPAYASCQVLEGEAADARDDVYALACIAYVLLTGKHPFRDNTALNARTARLEPRRPRGLSPRQWKVLRAGLNHDRDRRPSDMRVWLERLDLRTSASLPPLLSFWTARPRRRSDGKKWAVGVALAAALAACGWWAYTNPDSVTLASDAVRTSVTAIYERVASQVWRRDLSLGGQAEPVIRPPDSPPDTADAAGQPDAAAVRANVPAGPSAVPRNKVGSPASLDAAPSHAPAAPTASAALAAPTASAAPAAPTASAALAAPTSPATVRASAPALSAASAAASPAGAEAAQSTTAGQNGSAARARVELAADNVEVPPDEPMAHVVVRRSRAMHGDVSFNWWTESGTAKPGRDFVPVNTQVEHIENGQSAISLIIPVVVDPSRRESRNFYVVIDQPSDNAMIGPRTLTMVTLPGSEPEASETPDR